ncbi:MAG: hypothetical protein IT425_00940 [Pirellulales bacterium]|nr:hypothetical protein [Pirellulales bacterium]
MPSRFDNPFATCWTRPGALAFRFAEGQSGAGLVEALRHRQWRGAIIGPHGSGKTTLLESLKPLLCAAGREVLQVALHNGETRLPCPVRATLASRNRNDRLLLVVDGYEQLGWLERFRVSRWCRRLGAGLLVTAHSRVRIPTLVELAPDARLVQQLACQLCESDERFQAIPLESIPLEWVADSMARHRGNVREVFFDLYDRYEDLHRRE